VTLPLCCTDEERLKDQQVGGGGVDSHVIAPKTYADQLLELDYDFLVIFFNRTAPHPLQPLHPLPKIA